MKKELSLYVHIPFCRQKCAYCDFPSFAGRENLMEAYVGRLVAEMKEKREYAREAYLSANERAGEMISLKEWREKAPPSFSWDKLANG